MHRKLNFSSKDRHRLPQKIGRHWKAKSKLCFVQCYLNQAEQRPMRLDHFVLCIDESDSVLFVLLS